MFKIGFTVRDVIRAVWSFVFGFVGFYALSSADILKAEDPTAAVAALASGAILAGLSALKNLLLADGTTIKG